MFAGAACCARRRGLGRSGVGVARRARPPQSPGGCATAHHRRGPPRSPSREGRGRDRGGPIATAALAAALATCSRAARAVAPAGPPAGAPSAPAATPRPPPPVSIAACSRRGPARLRESARSLSAPPAPPPPPGARRARRDASGRDRGRAGATVPGSRSRERRERAEHPAIEMRAGAEVRHVQGDRAGGREDDTTIRSGSAHPDQREQPATARDARGRERRSAINRRPGDEQHRQHHQKRDPSD